ncbi:MAG: right-handed parallel beta-helix repeat-containing protein [Armatimonadetes bacterium]|nr:right-handed parallel beta-helix repeat-containing protein [Armatimonadota bacterium]
MSSGNRDYLWATKQDNSMHWKMCCPNLIMALVLLLATTRGGYAATYYVATVGSDANPGSMTQPFRTIQKAANVMYPGDICYVRAGTYRETVRPARSGASGNPIRFEAYHGEMVTVSGSDELTAWQLYQGAIYRSTISWPTEQVFVDGQMMIEARWPNTGLDLMRQNYATAEPGTQVDRIVDSRLTQPNGYWTGALLWVNGGAQAKAAVTRVTNFASRTLYFEMTDMSRIGRDYLSGSTMFDPIAGIPYYLTRGPLSTLDVETEWWLDRQSNRLYLWLPGSENPDRHIVEAKRRDFAFDLSGLSHITVSGFHIFASTITMQDSSYCKVDNCHLRYLSHLVEVNQFAGPASAWEAGRYDTGAIMGGQYNELRDSTIAYSAGNGVSLRLYSTGNSIINCLIHDVNYIGIDCAVVNCHGSNHTIQHNTMYNSGDSVIMHRMLQSSRIEYNHLYNAGMLNHDLGLTYSGGSDGNGTVIAYNWCHDSPRGCGIYLDNGSSNFLVHHNVVWNVRNGNIQINQPSRNNKIYNNTTFPPGNAVSCGYLTTWNDMSGSRIINNLFIGQVNPETSGQWGNGAVVANNVQASITALRNPTACDFRLAPGSPGIDAGQSIPGITDGYSGWAPDAGAYEGESTWAPGYTPPAPGSEILSPAAAKSSPAGWTGYIKGIVTGLFPDYNEFAVEAEDRSSAIMVTAPTVASLGIAPGDEVLVYGSITADKNVETVSSVPGVSVTRTGRNVTVGPVGIGGEEAGGTDGIGLSTRDMLVTVWGRVLLHAPITLPDGSKAFDITDDPVPNTSWAFFQDNFDSGIKNPAWVDYGSPTTVSSGRLTSAAGVEAKSAIRTFFAKDMFVSVDARSNAASNIMLRTRGPNSFLSTQYNPSWGDNVKRMYVQEYVGGQWLGIQSILIAGLSVGPDIHIEALLQGPNLRYTLTDGTNSYQIDYRVQSSMLLESGSVGLHYGGGPFPPSFDNFVAWTFDQIEGSVRALVPPSVTLTQTLNPGDYVKVAGIADENGGLRAVKVRQANDISEVLE